MTEAREQPPAVVRVLEKASDILHERGWIQHEGMNASGVCASQAINLAWLMLYETHDRGRCIRVVAFERFRAVIRCRSIAAWNDQSERTYEDVILALKEAAAL